MFHLCCFLFGKSGHHGADRASRIFTGSTMKGTQVLFSGLRGSALPSGETTHGRMAPIDSPDQDPLMMIPRFIVAALCILAPLTCVAHAGGTGQWRSYLHFLPGARRPWHLSDEHQQLDDRHRILLCGTPTQTRGFVRDADGTITTFDVDVAGVVYKVAGEHQCPWGHHRLL